MTLPLGEWDPDVIPVEDLVRGCLIFLEVGIMQPKLQVLGGTALLDCEGITLKHMRQLTPSVVMQIINVTGFAFPIYQRGMHIINCSRLFEKLFYVFKRFAPSDELWERVHFHGYDLTSLHRYIDPECLPKRYGGRREPVSLRDWLSKIKQYKNKQFDEDMKSLGVTRACWRASEWSSARNSLNPRARRSEGIVGLRAPHVRPNLGSGDDWS
ncbi:jg4874 [Pararge aegeria aegeria]|uniref:Jg4874 protein n=1 Tax=Pararge aegeria aegeria TaxID=348720 RepID=A0A8S4R664_9NEOP|nr:jg4874 [Pararge aegeria aegeria]